MTLNAYQWRTVAILIRNHLKVQRPVSTARAMKFCAKLRSGEIKAPELLHQINSIVFER